MVGVVVGVVVVVAVGVAVVVVVGVAVGVVVGVVVVVGVAVGVVMTLATYFLGAFLLAALANAYEVVHHVDKGARSVSFSFAVTILFGLAWPLVALIAFGLIVRKVLARGA